MTTSNRLTDDERARFPPGTRTLEILADRTERLDRRIANLEGVVRRQREALDTIAKKREGDAAEIEALKRGRERGDHTVAACPVKGCAICVERAAEAPDVAELRRRYEHHIKRVEDAMCETTRAEFAATESLRVSYRGSIDDLARALSALRRVCDALEVLPGVASGEIPKRVDEVLAWIGTVEEREDKEARRQASAFRTAGEQRALELVTLQEDRAKDLRALLDALGMQGDATGPHAWQAAIERARAYGVDAYDDPAEPLPNYMQAIHQRDVARADLAACQLREKDLTDRLARVLAAAEGRP